MFIYSIFEYIYFYVSNLSFRVVFNVAFIWNRRYIFNIFYLIILAYYVRKYMFGISLQIIFKLITYI